MATEDLMQIYEDIVVKKISHCALCYQSDGETRLVKSMVFKKVLRAMKYSQIFMMNEMLCYMCEAHMVSVSKFVDMLHLALEVQRVFMRAEMSGQYKKNIMAGRLNICQKDFARLRKKVQLNTTNTLVVDSFKANYQRPYVSPVPITPPTAPPTTPPTIQCNSNVNPVTPVIPKVLIKDKVPADKVEVDTTIPVQQLDPIEIPFALANPTNNVIIGIGADNSLYMVPALPIHSLSRIPLTALQIDISNKPKKNLKKRPNKPSKFSNKKGKHFGLPTIVDCRTDNNAFNEEIILGDTGPDTVVGPVLELVKLPIRTTSEVDWEDKIPMEVISFADDDPAPKVSDEPTVGQYYSELQSTESVL